ncbi:polysaccharide biosynthesis tyrosine autokinase [Desulforhopalus vacuolatus]|uniref:GumC family protein n=1 Tax=Desulforhopalus vacuolatus TaxID=40414 RepID=UPI001963B9B5|nr:polysaccharide biosynthesis tyrosine autokinase [Desulforhopalus vacuolatus]MBM9519360.1 polysaccharide biosynthesis tyrosine autokinase [Desulforhopalus vacuolatus]
MQQHETQQENSTEDEIDLRGLLQVVLKRKGLITIIFFIVLLMATIANFTMTPQYTASSNVLIERNHGTQGLDIQTYAGDSDFLETQSAIIKSLNVARRVVKDLDLTGKYHTFFFKKESAPSFVDTMAKGLRSQINRITDFMGGHDSLHASQLLQMSAESGIATSLSEEDILANQLSEELQIQPIRNTRIVTISYTFKNPLLAKMITEAVVKAYKDEMMEIKLAAANYSLTWMTDKAEVEKIKLEDSERALQKYMKANGLVRVEESIAVNPQRMREFVLQLSRAEAQRKETEAVLAQIKKAGKSSRQLEKIPIFANSLVLKDMRVNIYKAKQKQKELSKKYGPRHPQMIQATDELAVLYNERQFEIQRIIDSTRNTYSLAKSQEQNIRDLLNSAKDEAINSSEKYIQYTSLKRKVESNQMFYDTLQENIKKTGITDQSQSVNIWVVKKAEVPVYPSQPNAKKLLALGAVLGLALGFGMAFFLEFLDNTVKAESELEKRYGRTVLGTVEFVNQKKQNIKTFLKDHPLSPFAESYRLIRSGLLLSSADKPPKKILITSMDQGEGKTTTAINIAKVLSQDNKKVLLLDCDMRKPTTHIRLNVENESGLSDYLTGNTAEINVQDVDDENILLVTSGPIPPNPAELLASEKMKHLLAALSEKYDFVILDSPPVQPVSDSLALTAIVDGTIVVVLYEKTTFDTLNVGMKKMKDIKAHILGFVLNSFNPGTGKSYYASYSSYYTDDFGEKKPDGKKEGKG